MKPNTPILMLSLLIPITPDTSAEQVINIIGHQVAEALQQIQVHQANAQAAGSEEDNGDPEAISREEFNASLPKEMLEAYTAETRDDLLGKLGYTSEV